MTTMITLPKAATGEEGVQVEAEDLAVVLGMVASETGRKFHIADVVAMFGEDVAVKAEAIRQEVNRLVTEATRG